ncbi:MFS transporter [Pseudodonghicola xiamenensis]|uniref:MFS transporter n=1 Tax=Pseudodonghicola xiamenensis TaxID=337702 RepID=A0A8J3H6P5_9RHOB|nr:MFS transporter [Pseudodonghicola xiamenensis]GHG93447.1 MFS transporter [Pseudodonghicola xiamenensis]
MTTAPATAEASRPEPVSAPAPALPFRQALPYVAAGGLVAIAQGLGQGFVSTNIPQIAGDLGITTTQASWLMVAYIVPRAALPPMLIKIRTQFGLRRFAEIGIVIYALVAFAAVWISDWRSAMVVQALSGAASAPLSTLAFLYILEPMSPRFKMVLGLPLVMAFLLAGPSLARVVSPALIGDGGLQRVHLTALGLGMLSLAAVFRLPLRPVPHAKVIQLADLCSVGLILIGFAGVATAFVIGPIRWWTDAAWIGWALAGAVAALALAMVIELRRETPLLDVRWLASPAILHLTATLFLFRLILSEQTSGAPRMLMTLGMAGSQMTALFAVIVIATFVGAMACLAWMRPGREAYLHLAALSLIAVGAFMDSHATYDTRPEQMLISQALIAVAGMLFMPPAMMAGLLSALAKGPNYILSFVIVFVSTQSLGGVIGAGVFSTVVNLRQAFHFQQLSAGLTVTDPGLANEMSLRAMSLAAQTPDLAQRKLQAAAQIASDASRQAYVLAYNDAYFLTFLIALGAAAALLLHLFRDALVARLAPAAPSSDPKATTQS